jgi:hypothetical protein
MQHRHTRARRSAWLNDRFFTISHNGIFNEIKATPVGDDVFEFVDHEAGQPFVVMDMDGNVLLRDRGLISFTYLFDTGSDELPGGQFIELLDIRVSGPHPGFFLAAAGQGTGSTVSVHAPSARTAMNIAPVSDPCERTVMFGSSTSE